MTGRSWWGVGVVAALVACGGGEERPATEFRFDPDTATPLGEINLLRLDREAAASGVARLDGDLLLPLGTGEATARVTLQHVIDSLAATDTMVGAIRLTGFMMDPRTTSATDVQINPVIMARWVPEDTVGVTGVRRRARYRTHFVVLAPLPSGGGSTLP